MGLSSTANRADHTGDGSTVAFAYTFRIRANTDLLVTTRTSAGVEATKTLTTHYTVSGVGSASGGTVTFLVAPASGVHITIRRKRPLTQTADIRNQSSYYPESHEDAFDHMVMLAQQLEEQWGRSVHLPETIASSVFDPVLPTTMTAESYLRVNEAGDGWDLVTIDGAPLTEHLADTVDAHDASAISVSPSGNLAADDVQEALVELQTDIDNLHKVTGSRASPTAIVAGTGVSPDACFDQTMFIQGSGGAVDISANPQIAVGTTVGQRLRLIGCSDTNTVTFDHGTGLDLNGQVVLGLNWILDLVWDGTTWIQTGLSERA